MEVSGEGEAEGVDFKERRDHECPCGCVLSSRCQEGLLLLRQVLLCVQAGFELEILLLQPPERWNYKRGHHGQLPKAF